MLASEQRRNKIISQKQRQMSEHSKKVKEKLTNYHTAQRSQYRKATADQKRFSETMSDYWKGKTQ